MNRNARRAVLFVCLAVSAGILQSGTAAAGDVCVFVGGQPLVPCTATGVGTTQCVGTGSGGASARVCAPIID
jgi:hypothetical protein